MNLLEIPSTRNSLNFVYDLFSHSDKVYTLFERMDAATWEGHYVMMSYSTEKIFSWMFLTGTTFQTKCNELIVGKNLYEHEHLEFFRNFSYFSSRLQKNHT